MLVSIFQEWPWSFFTPMVFAYLMPSKLSFFDKMSLVFTNFAALFIDIQ